MADWSSLPSDLIRKIGKCFLATDDLDYYMDFRAVCGNWRRATDDPKADGTDPRFLPSKWVMLGHSSILADATVTFANVSTGRFLRMSIPRLRKYFFVGATVGGLLVLGEEEPPYQIRVLNAFTGAIARFKAPILAEEVTVAVTASPMMVFISGVRNEFVRWADQNSESFQEGFAVSHPDYLMNMTPFAGGVHVTNRTGSIISSIDVATEEGTQGPRRQRSARAITMATTIPAPTLVQGSECYYLVESEGELLLVIRQLSGTGPVVVVYKVDTVNKVLEPVRSIGSRALFVSSVRCLSVDAERFHTVEAGCIYYVDQVAVGAGEYESYCITMLRVADGWVEPTLDLRLLSLRGCFHPFTLVQVFADYCRTVEFSALELVLYGEYDDYFYDGNEWDGSFERSDG